MASTKIIMLIVFLAIGGTIAARRKRFTGGKSIKISQAPYLVTVRCDGGNICRGALISPNHVLTVAHCVTDHNSQPYKVMWVLCGTNQQNGQKCHLVSGIHTSDKYMSAQMGGDGPRIAILILSRPVELNSEQNIISATYGKIAKLIGFDTESFSSDTDLRRVDVKMLHPHQCSDSSESDKPSNLRTICVRRKSSVELVNPDDGGPLVYEGKLVGLISHTNSRSPNSQYPNILYFKNFIKSMIYAPV